MNGEGTPTTAARRRTGVSMVALITFLFAVGGLAHGLGSLHDNSFLWHLRTGHWILDHGIPRRDPYSFTAMGTRWIAQSWLAELLYGALDSVFGVFAIRLAVGVATAVVATLMYRTALRTSEHRVRALAVAIPALACNLAVWSERPLIFGLALFAGLVFAIEVPDSFVGRHLPFVVPIVMWFWVNVHGTFALGFVYLAFHLAGRWLEGSPPNRGRERDLLIGTAIAAVIVFVNPYGAGLILFPVALLGRGKVLSDVAEWQSVNFRTLTGFFYAFWMFLTIVLFARSRPGRRDLLLSVLFLFLGLWAVRNVGIAVLVTIPILGRALRVDDPSRASDAARVDAPAPGLLPVLIGLVSVLLVFSAALKPNFDLDKQYPVATLRALDREHLLGQRLLTTDAWAGYVIYRYWPRQHVFFDDRYDMYPLALDTAYLKVLSLRPGWEKVLNRVDIIVWPKNGGLVQGLKHLSGWKKIRQDKLAVVYVRT